MTIIAATLVFATQGCCSWCRSYPREVTHTIALAPDMLKCPDAKCVCPLPDVISVHRGDKVEFENASLYRVKISPAVPGTFTEGDVITVDSGQTVLVTVSDSVSVGTQVTLNMTVDPPGVLCPGMAGPRMDIDD